jgi:hypothetical protein
MPAEPEYHDDRPASTAPHADPTHLRRVAQANTAVRLAQAELRMAVETARRSGCTWEAIATALGAGTDDTASDVPTVSDIVQTVLGTC